MRLRPDAAKPKFSASQSETNREDRRGKPTFKKPAPKKQAPKIGALYDAPYVPLGQGTQEQKPVVRNRIRTDYKAQAFPSIGRPAPIDSVRTAPDVQLMDIPHERDYRYDGNANSSAYSGAAYIKYLEEQGKEALKRDIENLRFNTIAFKGSYPKRPTANHQRFEQDLDKNPLYKKILSDPVHGKELVVYASSIGLPIPDDAIVKYTSSIVDGLSAGVMSPEEIPDLVLTNSFKPTIRNIQANVKALGYDDAEIRDMNFGQLLQALAGKGKYRTLGGPFKHLPGNRFLPTTLHNVPPSFAKQVVGLVPAAVGAGNAFVQDVATGFQQMSAGASGKQVPGDQIPLPRTREFAKEMAKEQYDFAKQLASHPVATFQSDPVTTGLILWSLMRGGAGALGRVPKFSRTLRARQVRVGHFANEGEAGVITHSNIPDQTMLPGMDEAMPPMPGGPVRGIQAPLAGPHAGAPTVHERQHRIGGMEGNFGATDANGRLIFDAQAVKQEFSKRTGRHMTPDELAHAKREWEYAFGVVKRLDSGRLSHAEAEHIADTMRQHVDAAHAKIEEQRAATEREAQLMRGVDIPARVAERTANLRTVRNERNQLAADIHAQEQGLNNVLTPENFTQAIASHEASIKDLEARIESGKFPTQEAPLRQMIDIHTQLIDTLHEQHSNTAGAHRAARNNIRGMQDKLRRMDNDLLNEHLALNIPHPSVERRIPELEAQLHKATKEQAPAEEQAAIKAKLDAARTIGQHDVPTEDFYNLTRNMDQDWFDNIAHGLPLWNRNPVSIAHSAYEHKHLAEGTHTPESEDMHFQLEDALAQVANSISTGRRIETTIGVDAVKKAAREVWGPDWHTLDLHEVTKADRLKMVDFLQRAQKYLVNDTKGFLANAQFVSSGPNVEASFRPKRREQLAKENIAKAAQDAREQAFREATSGMNPEQIAVYRQETGAGRVGVNTTTGKKRISPLLSVEGNVLHGRFPGVDPEGLRNPKINTWQRFNESLRNLDKFKDDESTLVQLQNRLKSMLDERRRKLNDVEGKKYNRPEGQTDNMKALAGDAMAERDFAWPEFPLERAAIEKLYNDLHLISQHLDTIYQMLAEFDKRPEGFLPYSKVREYTPQRIQFNNKLFYHGSGTPDLSADALSAYETSVDNLFGPGLYATDAIDVSDRYATLRSSYRDDKEHTIYEIQLNPERTNFIDMHKPLPKDAVLAFVEFGRAWDMTIDAERAREQSARSAWTSDNEDIPEGVKLHDDIVHAISRGMTGEEVWDHISSALIHWGGDPDGYYGLLHKLRRDLLDAGFDGLQHIGGQRVGGEGEHHVVIMFEPNKSVKDMGKARTTNAPSWKRQADEARAEADRLNPPPGTDLVPYKDRTPVFSGGGKEVRDVKAEIKRMNERERQAAKAIHGDTPPKQIPPVKGGAVGPSRQMTGTAVKKISDPLLVYRMPYSKNLIDRAVEWIDDRMLESTNPNLRAYQEYFLRNRYAAEQGHVRRAFYMWREDLGPLLDAAKNVTTEEGLAVANALAQGVTVDQMVRASQKLVDMNVAKLARENVPDELTAIVDGQVPDDNTLAIAEKFAEDNNMPEHARVIRDFRKKMKDKDWIDDGLFNAYVSSWWEPDVDLRKQADFWKTVQSKVPEKPNAQMLHLLDEMRKASKGVDDMLESEGILTRSIMDNRRYQRQNIVSSILNEPIALDTEAVYVPDRASIVHPGEHLLRRSRRYDPEGVFGGRLQKHKGRLLMSGKINPTFGSYYTALTSAKSKVEAIKLQRDILETYAHKLPTNQLTYDKSKFYLYNGKTGITYRDIATREILKELTSVMGGEEVQYGLADLGNRQDLPQRGVSTPLHMRRDIQRLTPDEIAASHRGDLYLVPHPIWEGITGQVLNRQARTKGGRYVQQFTNWWRTLVLKLRPAYLPVNIAESGGRAALYGGVGPLSYYRLARMNAKFGHLTEEGTARKSLFPGWLHRTTFTGDVTTKLHLGSQTPTTLAVARKQARDFMVKAERDIREQVPFGGVGVDLFKFFPGLGYGDAIFRMVADGENAMRQAHVAKGLLREARNQRYDGRWWHPGRYTDRLDDNMFLMMKKIADGKDITRGAAMDEILRDTTRLLGDFSKAHHAGLAIVAPFYRWIGFIAKFTLMEAMYRRPARAYLYGQLSQMSWTQLQSLGILPSNIAGAIPLGDLEEMDKKDPDTGQRDKMLSVLYSQAWNGPMTLLNVAGYDPGRGEFNLGQGIIKQVNPLAQLAFAATMLRDPSTMREFTDRTGHTLDHTDLIGSNVNILLAQFARQLWPVMLGQDYSEMADTSIPYLHDVFKDEKAPLGQPQSTTGEKLFATATGLRRRQIDLTKLQLGNIKKAKAEMRALYDGLKDNRRYPHGESPAQKKFRLAVHENWLNMLSSIDQWWQLHHTNPFDPEVQAGVTETVPSVLESDAAEEAFNKANR